MCPSSWQEQSAFIEAQYPDWIKALEEGEATCPKDASKWLLTSWLPFYQLAKESMKLPDFTNIQGGYALIVWSCDVHVVVYTCQT